MSNPCGERPLYYGTWTDADRLVHWAEAFNGQHYFMICGATVDFDVLLESKVDLLAEREVTCVACIAGKR